MTLYWLAETLMYSAVVFLLSRQGEKYLNATVLIHLNTTVDPTMQKKFDIGSNYLEGCYTKLFSVDPTLRNSLVFLSKQGSVSPAKQVT